ncbi:hypothetical protein L873DRAFT_869618 [Choiromyces venosus 120613-1]|uniref:Uncharacterized protein n=1 Tax=Choiromyces venosus 120613-1 TaxID=1336337 RepID=A0A3N4JNW9_9PEZI|nr:hypothetical protein L873DRAFT_869618 [Choiromyces venosus 120613-1]
MLHSTSTIAFLTGGHWLGTHKLSKYFYLTVLIFQSAQYSHFFPVTWCDPSFLNDSFLQQHKKLVHVLYRAYTVRNVTGTL